MSPTQPDHLPVQTGKAILLVDDTTENLYAIGSLLQPHYRVRIANGGGAALKAVSTPPYPDLILLDIMMPGISGYEVLEDLRKNYLPVELPEIGRAHV